jgi:type VI secretion system protein ImpC
MPDEREPEVGFEVHVRSEPGSTAPIRETPFRIAVLGDFSGRANRGIVESGGVLAGRKAIRVDRDDLDDAVARLAPRLTLATEPPLSLAFERLDDFHPDSLYESLPIFARLLETRARLADPKTSADAVRELLADTGPSVSAEDRDAEAGGLLDQILDRTSPAPADAAAALTSDFNEVVSRIVRPYMSDADARGPELLEQVNEATSSLMRALLHHPDVRSLEASWRAVHFLTRGVETDEHLQIWLIDVSKQELAADQDSDADLRGSGLYKLLVESTVETPGAEPWALIVGDFAFGPNDDELLLLARLAAIANLAGAPWISAAEPGLAGIEDFATPPDATAWRPPESPLWEALRKEPQAVSLGLALPRFLLRLPYSPDAEPCDSFPFREAAAPPDHDDYLWGNPAYACATLLARSFSADGWELRPGAHQDVKGLPLHVYKVEGDTEAKPCAEALLSERAAGLLLDRGLMPLASMKQSDSVRLVRFQSVSNPPQALAGRW